MALSWGKFGPQLELLCEGSAGSVRSCVDGELSAVPPRINLFLEHLYKTSTSVRPLVQGSEDPDLRRELGGKRDNGDE